MFENVLFFVLMSLIVYLNYRLSKSYWCHEGVWGDDIHQQ
jgi:hypothetical protein